MSGDADYFRQRACQERRAALAATEPSIRLRHLEFAHAYELRVQLLGELEAPLTPEIVQVA